MTGTRPFRCHAARCRLVVFAALLGTAVVACGGSAGERAAPASDRSSPFTAGPPPEGYRPIIAGRGTQVQSWGEDEVGTVEPFTVLAPPGQGADSPDAVVVSVTGYEGYQGGLAQASAGYPNAGELLVLGGRPAVFVPAGRRRGGESWADLVAVRGPGLAVRATGRHATRKELIRVQEEVQPAESHRVAPTVPKPPAGLRVVGSVDADMVLALEPAIEPYTDVVPGPGSGHGVAWYHDTNRLAVMTLPGRTADHEALAGFVRFSNASRLATHLFTLEGRPAALLDSAPTDDGEKMRVVVTTTAWGDLTVTAARGPEVPTRDRLVRLAASVEQATSEAWERFMTDAAGGPGLHADDGAVEVARGRAGEVGWLLQARQGMGGHRVDTCLKLTTGRRACTEGSAGSPSGSVWSAGDPVRDRNAREVPAFPSFTVVESTTGGAKVRVRTAAGEATADLHPIPGGGGASATVVFVDRPAIAGCATPPRPVGPNVTRVEVLGSDGRVIACIGP